MAQETAVKATTRTTMPGTTLPSVKSISILASTEIPVKIDFHEFIGQHQESALQKMFANHKSKNSPFFLAMQVDGRTIRFRRLGNKPLPEEQSLRQMLDSMGIGEITVLQTPSPSTKKKVTQNKVTAKQSHSTHKTGLSAHQVL